MLKNDWMEINPLLLPFLDVFLELTLVGFRYARFVYCEYNYFFQSK